MRFQNAWKILTILLLIPSCQAKLELSVNPESGDKSTWFNVDYEITGVDKPHTLTIKLIKCYLRGSCSDTTNLGEKTLLSEKVAPGAGSYAFLIQEEAWLYRFCGTYSGYGSDCDKDNQFLLQNNLDKVIEKEIIKWQQPEPNMTLSIQMPEKILAGNHFNVTINITNHLNQTVNTTLNAYAYNGTSLATSEGWNGNQENLTLSPYTSLTINKTLETKDVEGVYTLKIKTGQHETTRQITVIKPVLALEKVEVKENKTRITLTNRGELGQEASIMIGNITETLTIKPQTTKVQSYETPEKPFFISVQSLGINYSQAFAEKKECPPPQITGAVTAKTIEKEESDVLEYALTGVISVAGLALVLKKT